MAIMVSGTCREQYKRKADLMAGLQGDLPKLTP